MFRDRKLFFFDFDARDDPHLNPLPSQGEEGAKRQVRVDELYLPPYSACVRWKIEGIICENE
jgi:hypothetical protein